MSKENFDFKTLPWTVGRGSEESSCSQPDMALGIPENLAFSKGKTCSIIMTSKLILLEGFIITRMPLKQGFHEPFHLVSVSIVKRNSP